MDNNIEAMIKATIQAKVVEAFNSAPDMVEKLIAAAFSKQVDENGQPPSYSSHHKMSYLDWMVGDEIRKAGLAAVREYVSQHEATIKEKVVKSINEGQFGDQIGSKVAEMMANEWNWSFTVGDRQ